MSKIEGGVPVTGFISPTDSEDTYATHKDIYGQGGYRSVANIAERDAIPVDRRSEGMLVFVKDTNLTYQLIDGTENTHWVTKSDVGIDSLTENYIIVGNELNEPQASAALIDVQEDIAIIYERLDEIQGVGTGGGTQDRGTRDLSGFVIGDVEPDGSMYTVRGPDCGLNVIPAWDDVDLSMNRITNVGDPFPNDGTLAGELGETDATNRRYVDEHKWLAESITDLDSTITSYSLDQFNPPAVNLDFNNKVLGNVATSNNPNDAATVEYVNNAIEEIGESGSSITLTGAVTGSGTDTIKTTLTPITTGQISNFDTAVTNYSLSQFQVPTQSLSMNSKQITFLAAPTAGTDAANKTYVDNTASTAVSNRTTTLTGDVTGTGTGNTITTTLAKAVTSYSLSQFQVPTGPINMNSWRVTSLATPTLGADATNKDYVDATAITTANTAVSNRTTTLTGAVTGSNTGNTINTTLTPITTGQISNFDTAVKNYSLSDFKVPMGPLSMGGYKVTSLATPTLGADATNKDYVDNAVSTRPYGCQLTVNNPTPQAIIAGTGAVIGAATVPSGSNRGFNQLSNGILRCDTTTTYLYNVKATLEIECSSITRLTFQIVKDGILPGLSPAFTLDITAVNTKYVISMDTEAVSLVSGSNLRLYVTTTNQTNLTVVNRILQAISI